MNEKRTIVRPHATGSEVRRPAAAGSNTRVTFDDYEDVARRGCVLPATDDFGNQVGVSKKTKKRKLVHRSEAVDLNTAQHNMRLRKRGEMPEIDDEPPRVTDTAACITSHGIMTHRNDAPDALVSDGHDVHGAAYGDTGDKGEMFGGTLPPYDGQRTEIDDGYVSHVSDKQTDNAVVHTHPSTIKRPPPPPPTVPPADSVYTTYLHSSKHISFGVEGGTYRVPAVDIRESDVGVFVILPASDHTALFTPSMGANVRLTWDGKGRDCFFPGNVITIDELGIHIMSFIYAEDKHGKT